MKFKLYTDVALTCDLPEHRLRRGDIVKLRDHHIAPDGTVGYSIEVFNAVGDTIAVIAVPGYVLPSPHSTPLVARLSPDRSRPRR